MPTYGPRRIANTFFTQCIFNDIHLKICKSHPGWAAPLAAVSSCTPKGCGFNSWSGHMPTWVSGSVPSWAAYGRQPISVSHVDAFLSLSSPLLLPLKSINISLGEEYRQICKSLARCNLIFLVKWV